VSAASPVEPSVRNWSDVSGSSEEPLFDWVFLPPARAEYQRLNWSDRIQVDHRIDFLCRSPFVDNVLKHELVLDDGFTLTLFDDDEWQIIYLLVAPRVIEIWALQHIEP
jgi:hypothetical protein